MGKTEQIINNTNILNNDIDNILLLSNHLLLYYDIWNNNLTNSILNLEENSLCNNLKKNNPNLDDKFIKSIVLSIYINMYYFTNSF